MFQFEKKTVEKLFVCVGLTSVTAQIWLFKRNYQALNLAERMRTANNRQRKSKQQTHFCPDRQKTDTSIVLS